MSDTEVEAPAAEPIVHAVTLRPISSHGTLVQANRHVRMRRSLAEEFLRKGAIRKLNDAEKAQVYGKGNEEE